MKLTEKGRRARKGVSRFFVLVIIGVVVWQFFIRGGPAALSRKIAEIRTVPTATPAIVVVAKTATPVSAKPTAVLATATPVSKTAEATATNTQVQPTTEQATEPQPTLVSTAEEEITVAGDSFGSYFTVCLVDQMKRSYSLKVIPFLIDGKGGKYDFSEEQRASNIKDGTWDILLTTADGLAKKGNIGKIVAYIDQSAGADKIIAWPESVTQPGKKIGYFNDLKGMTITFSEGSVGQYQVLALLRVVLLTSSDVKFLPAQSVAEAVDLFLTKKADAVAGWEPDINKATEAGGIELASSSWWRNVSDVIVVSDNANTTKKEAVKAFLRDWFFAVKQQQGGIDAAASAIASWKFDGQPTNDWTYVYPDGYVDEDGFTHTSVEDLASWLGSIAQAGIGENTVLMQDPQLIVDQLSTAREVWAWGNLTDTETPFDPAAMIETSYVLELSQDRSLYPASGASFVNPNFQATSPKLPAADPNVLVKLPSLAELPIKRLDFEPNSSVIKKENLDAIVASAKAMIQMTRVSDVQILVTGYSAWPVGYDEPAIWQQARERSAAVKMALVKAGLDPNRITSREEIPPEQDRRINDEARLVQYRKVTIEAKRGGK